MNSLIARIEESQDGSGKVSIQQPVLRQEVLSILSQHFGCSVEFGYVIQDRWLEDTPPDVQALIEKIYKSDHTLGIILFERQEDEDGLTKEDYQESEPGDFPIREGALAVSYLNGCYLIAQWRSDDRAPTAIPEMKRIIQNKLEQDFELEFRSLRAFDASPFTFSP